MVLKSQILCMWNISNRRQIINMTMKKFFSFVGLCLLAFLATSALANDVPKRKSGLWEIKWHMEGIPDMGPTLECVDQNTDTIMQQGTNEENPDCKAPDVKRSGDKVTIHTECKLDETTTISLDYLLQGSFDSAYKGTVKSQTKSSKGTSTTSMTLDARWLGPCKPGQKPGDVIEQ
jgi:hypothetical protein